MASYDMMSVTCQSLPLRKSSGQRAGARKERRPGHYPGMSERRPLDWS